MNGVFLVTGATNGIGREITRGLVSANKRVAFIARSLSRAEKTSAELCTEFPRADIIYFIADLESMSEVRRVASEILDRCQTIDGLINNAGVVMGKHTVTSDGIETTFAVNHLSHFLLTTLLLDRIKENPGARIINIASNAHHFVKSVRFDDIGWKKGYRPLKVYGQSKLANILFTRELAKQLAGTGVTVNAVDPGSVGTTLGSNNGRLASLTSAFMRPFFRPVPVGAKTAIYLALSPNVASVSGELFKDNKIIQVSDAARSIEQGARLWSLSETLVR